MLAQRRSCAFKVFAYIFVGHLVFPQNLRMQPSPSVCPLPVALFVRHSRLIRISLVSFLPCIILSCVSTLVSTLYSCVVLRVFPPFSRCAHLTTFSYLFLYSQIPKELSALCIVYNLEKHMMNSRQIWAAFFGWAELVQTWKFPLDGKHTEIAARWVPVSVLNYFGDGLSLTLVGPREVLRWVGWEWMNEKKITTVQPTQ